MATLAQVPIVNMGGIDETADPIAAVAPPAKLEYLQGAVYAVHVAMAAPYVVPVLTLNHEEASGAFYFGVRTNVGARGLAPWVGIATNADADAVTGTVSIWSTSGGAASEDATEILPPTSGAWKWPPTVAFDVFRGGTAGEDAAPTAASDRVIPLTPADTPATERCYGTGFHSFSGTLYHVADLLSL